MIVTLTDSVNPKPISDFISFTQLEVFLSSIIWDFNVVYFEDTRLPWFFFKARWVKLNIFEKSIFLWIQCCNTYPPLFLLKGKKNQKINYNFDWLQNFVQRIHYYYYYCLVQLKPINRTRNIIKEKKLKRNLNRRNLEVRFYITQSNTISISISFSMEV